MYEAFENKDTDYIKNYYSDYLPFEPFNFSLVIALDNEGKVVDYFCHYPIIHVEEILSNKEFLDVVKKSYEGKRNGDINNGLISGFIKISDKIFAFAVSPILDDKDLGKPPAGILFLGREISSNFLEKVNSYLTSPLVFYPESRDFSPEFYNYLKREISVFDIKGNYLGKFISYYDFSPVKRLYKDFYNFFLVATILIFLLSLLSLYKYSSYFYKRFANIERHAMNNLALNSSSGLNEEVANKIPDPFERINTVITILSNEVKDKLNILEAQKSKFSELYSLEKRYFEDTIKMLSSIVELKDPYTKGHAERVSKLAVKIGKKLGFSEDQIETLSIASLLHDLGKIIIPENILNKPGNLSKEEFEIIKYHPTYGYHILKENQTFEKIANIVLCHHENIDGTGYPRGIKGDEIPIKSKIISVADVFDALTTDRPYRKAYSREEALKIMEKDVGKKFDEKIFEVFKQVMEEEERQAF